MVKKISFADSNSKNAGGQGTERHESNQPNILYPFSCHSDLGKKVANNAPTQISIGKGCQSDAVIMHLLLHALGKFK